MQILDGKHLSGIIKDDLKKKVQNVFIDSGLLPPHLCIIQVGNEPASSTYVRNKIKSCEETGFNSSLLLYDSSVSETEIIDKIKEINHNPDIDGLIVQLPLPQSISVEKIIETIDPGKDVDGFHPLNLGKMAKGQEALLPATPRGILEIFKYYQIKTEGKNVLIIGRSHLVGSPLSILMSRKATPGDSTVTLANSKTKNIKEMCLNADIIVACLGSAHFIKEDMVSEGVVVIDVGTNSIPDSTKKSGYRLTGDVDFEKVSQKASSITPVPGGVGLMTIAALLQNTFEAAVNRRVR